MFGGALFAVGSGEEGFDFGAEANAAVAVGLVADVDDAGAAERFFLRVAGDFCGHTKHGFNGHADLQGCGRRKIKAAARDVQNFREMFRFVRSQTHRAKTERCPKVVAFQMATLRNIQGNLLRAKEGHCGSIKAEGQGKSKQRERAGQEESH